MELTVLNTSGETAGKAQVSDTVFGALPNPDLLHQVLVAQQANQRHGTSNTLTRGQVSGGGRKPFMQKGTGRARQGTIRAPQMRHGGIVFGPHPRSYRQKLPKRMRRQALRIALSGKLNDEHMRVVRGLESSATKTKDMAAALEAVGAKGSTLVVTRDSQPEIGRAVRNIPRAKLLPADLLNVLDLARYQTLVLTEDAVARIDELWADTSRVKKEAPTAA